MLQLLMFLAVAQDVGPGVPDRAILRDRVQGPTAVTDKDLRPIKAPECKTEAEVQRTLEQVSLGQAGDCFVKDMRRFSRR